MAFFVFFSSPNEKTFWNMFAVNMSYYLMPLVAGYMRSNSYVQYNKDQKTYVNSEISMDYIFAESMQLFKMGFWSFFNLLDDDVDIKEI